MREQDQLCFRNRIQSRCCWVKYDVDFHSFYELDTNLYVIFRKETIIVFQGNNGLEKAIMDVDKTKRKKSSSKAKRRECLFVVNFLGI